MTRSTDFGATVKHGVRAAQPDIVVHVYRSGDTDSGPKIGLVVSKAVGSAVQRHRVARRLRHVARTTLTALEARDRVVIRALPSSSEAASSRLEQELKSALQSATARAHRAGERPR